MAIVIDIIQYQAPCIDHRATGVAHVTIELGRACTDLSDARCVGQKGRDHQVNIAGVSARCNIEGDGTATNVEEPTVISDSIARTTRRPECGVAVHKVARRVVQLTTTIGIENKCRAIKVNA